MSKTVQKSGAQPAVRQDSHAVYPTHYSVKIHSLRPEGSCRATASVNINGCFAVRGIKVMDSSKGLFVSMPSYRAGNGEYPIPEKKRYALQTLPLAPAGAPAQYHTGTHWRYRGVSRYPGGLIWPLCAVC